MTAGQRDDLLMALGLVKAAMTDIPANTMPHAGLRVAADLMQGVYDGTRVVDDVVAFPGHSVKVPDEVRA